MLSMITLLILSGFIALPTASVKPENNSLLQSEYEPINLPLSILQKSIVNYGQLTPTVQKKLLNNQCIDWIAIGTSVTCVGGHSAKYHDQPTKFSDGWHFQLQKYLVQQNEICYRGATISQHRLLEVRCYNKSPLFEEVENGTVTKIEKANNMNTWLESIQLDRRNPNSLLLQADIIIVEALDDKDSDHTGKVTEQFIYSLLTLPIRQPAVIFLSASFHYVNIDGHIWSTLEKSINKDANSFIEHDRKFDSVLYQLPVVKHYGVPFVSFIDGFGPFITPESKAWLIDKYLVDTVCHITRTGHKIVASLLLNYLNVANSSVHYPLFDVGDEDMFVNVTSIPPVFHSAESLQAFVTEANPPLFINFDCFETCYSRWMIDDGLGWEVHHYVTEDLHHTLKSIDISKRGISSSVVDGAPFILVIPHEVLQVHFTLQILRIRVAKNNKYMGSLRMVVSLFGHHDKVFSDTVIDCMNGVNNSTHTSPLKSLLYLDSEEVLSSQVWFDEEVRLSHKLRLTDSLQVAFTIVPTSPARLVNLVKIAGLYLT